VSDLILTEELLVERLAGRRAKRLSASKRAAVAVLVQFDQGRPEVLLMRRAEREGDRWSGQVSFPGGKEDETDTSLQATAERETLEELGFDLRGCSRYLGPLDPIRAMARGKVIPTSISPHVYLKTDDFDIVLGEEATRAFWLPLDLAYSGELNDTYPYALGPARVNLKCWRFDGEVVWGLTFEMLLSMRKVLSR
jgi:8-oxo-dGTP pyrophosphatase MutT (NUDIX family)